MFVDSQHRDLHDWKFISSLKVITASGPTSSEELFFSGKCGPPSAEDEALILENEIQPEPFSIDLREPEEAPPGSAAAAATITPSSSETHTPFTANIRATTESPLPHSGPREGTTLRPSAEAVDLYGATKDESAG